MNEMLKIADTAYAWPQAWTGADFDGVEDVAMHLTDREVAALKDCVARAATKEVGAIGRADFAHPDLADLAGRLSQELVHGRGIVVLRGMPVADYAPEEAGKLFWGLGTQLGKGVSQSALGDLLGHVIDTTKPGEEQSGRGYLSRKELNLHNDPTELVGLMCYRQGIAGGDSVVTNALSIHNRMREEHPEHLPVLYRGFRYHRRKEEAEGAAPITPYRIPVFSVTEGKLSVFHVREVAQVALREEGKDFSPEEVAALDCFRDIANEIAFRFRMEPGDALLLNNYITLHGRTEFENGAEEAGQRHLLRLWLDVPDGRPKTPHIHIYENKGGASGIDPQPGRKPAGSEYNVK